MKLPETIGSPDGPTVEGASVELLRGLLDELDGALQSAGFDVATELRPGITEDLVRERLETLGLTAPDELAVWFSWHNGTNRSDRVHSFVPRFQLWSLDEAVYVYSDPNGRDHGDEEWEWNRNWLHFVGDNNGLAIQCASSASKAPLVRNISSDLEFGTQPDQTSHQVVSLCTPVTWWLDSLRNGWYVWHPETGRWTENPTMQSPIRELRGMS